MTKEDKELLLKDLCARLPYGVIILIDNKYARSIGLNVQTLIGIDLSLMTIITKHNCYKLEKIKPYLRPMSSMTEEEFNEFEELEWSGNFEHLSLPLLDWLNKKMFDYRGLIENGLALEAPKDMYNFKELI